MLCQPFLARLHTGKKIPEFAYQNSKKAGQHRQRDPQPPVPEIHIAFRLQTNAEKHCRCKPEGKHTGDQPAPPVSQVNRMQRPVHGIQRKYPHKHRKNAVGKSKGIPFQI